VIFFCGIAYNEIIRNDQNHKEMRKSTAYLMYFTILYQAAQGQDLENLASEKAFTLNGGVSARGVFYNASGIPSRRDPFAYVLLGNLNASIYGINLPFSFTYSNQGTIYGQPFNQFGLSPSYRWITMHIGYRNISHSSFTLAGHQLFGAGMELNPGKFRFSFMAGRLLRAVQSPEDTTLLSIREPVYRRTGWSAKIGYGTSSNFIDLIILKAADKPGSLNKETIPSGINPADNLVFGLNTRQAFLKNFNFYFDGAVSIWVRDRTYGGEPEEFTGILKFSENFIDLNSSAQAMTAFKTGLSYNGSWFSLASYWQRIDPDFQSMGMYFVNNDLQAISIAPSVILFNNKLRLNTSFTLIHDNLRNTKATTTKRTLPQVSISYNPLYNLGLVFTYTNISTLQQEGILPLDNELKMDNENPIYSFNGYYTISNDEQSHLFNLFYNRSEYIDNNLITKEFANYTGNILNLSYNYSLAPGNLNLNASFNSNNIETYNGNLPGTGFSIGGSKGFLNNKFSANINFSLSFQEDMNSQSLLMGADYKLDRQMFSLQVNYLNTVFSEFDYNELTGFIQYNYRL
jgi:hypothetical protein